MMYLELIPIDSPHITAINGAFAEAKMNLSPVIKWEYIAKADRRICGLSQHLDSLDKNADSKELQDAETILDLVSQATEELEAATKLFHERMVILKKAMNCMSNGGEDVTPEEWAQLEPLFDKLSYAV